MSDPRWYGPNASAKRVVSASGQFAGYHEGAPINAAQHARLTSDAGQEKILQALQHLEGRTDFKGRAMYHNMGSSDIRPNDRSNFYHYKEQVRKSDPLTPEMKRDDWKKFVSDEGDQSDASGGPEDTIQRSSYKSKIDERKMAAINQPMYEDLDDEEEMINVYVQPINTVRTQYSYRPIPV